MKPSFLLAACLTAGLILSSLATVAVAEEGTVRKLPTAGKLEGRDVPGAKGTWRYWTGNVEMGPRPDAAERAREVAARKAAMEEDIKRLRERLTRAPSAAKMQEIQKKAEELIELRGLAEEIPRAMTVSDLEAMAKNEDTLPQGLLDALVQFKNDLAARGVDFILVPVAPDCSVYMHELVPGLSPETEVWPGWTKKQLQLLENDIEIIDTVDEFRAHSKDPVAVIFPNDPHTGSGGRQIMGKALAERLQRYDFARALVPERPRFQYETKTEDGNNIFSGTLYFAKAWDKLNNLKGQQNPSIPGRTLFSQGSGDKISWLAPVNEAMIPGLQKLKETPFQYLEVKPKFERGEKEDILSRLELVMVGDSQLHSAVHGSGLPYIVGAEIGGRFRWASKSWGNFDASEIYLHGIVPDSFTQPRVCVMFFLPFKFNLKYDNKGNLKDEYKPKPMPAYGNAAVASKAVVTPTDKSFTATVRVSAVSQQKDPMSVQYKEALTQTVGVIVGGPYDGAEIGIRHWTMNDSQLISAAGNLKVGDSLKVTLQPWDIAAAKVKGISTYMVYNDTDLDLMAPIYWIEKGDLAPDKVLSNK